MRLIKTLFLLLVFLLPFGQLSRVPLNISGVNLYLQDFIIVLILSLGIFQIRRGKQTFFWPVLTKPILFFLGTAFFSLIINAFNHSIEETLIASLYLCRWTAFAGLYFIFQSILSWTVKPIKKTLLVAGLMTALFSLLQYFFWQDTRLLYFLGWDEHYFRAIGLHLDPGYTGIFCVLTLILIIEEKKLKKIIRFLMFVIVYLTMALTYSRASYLAYLAAFVLISWQKKSKLIFCVSFLIMVLTLILLPRPGGEGVKLARISSVETRKKSYQNALTIFKDQPIFGVGFNFYRYVQKDYGFLGKDWENSHAGAGVDASFLFVAATTGIFGLGSYLWLVREMFLIAPASTLALVIHGFFNNSLFYPWLMLWWWLIVIKENKSK